MSLWAWHLFQFMPACKLLLSAQETGQFIFSLFLQRVFIALWWPS